MNTTQLPEPSEYAKQASKKLCALIRQQIETPSAEEIQEILVKFLDFLEAKCKNEKIDKILEDIEQRVIDDRFGVLPFLLNFIKLKRAN